MADNLFRPNCRKKGASLCEDALNFIRFVYQDTSFDGLISLGTKDIDGNYKDIGPVPCTQIAQFTEEMVILPDHDYQAGTLCQILSVLAKSSVGTSLLSGKAKNVACT